MKTIFVLAWRNMFRNPRRTMASLMTIMLGSAGILIYQGYNTGLTNQYRENTIHGYYGHGQVFPAGYYGKVHEKPWEKWIENPEEVEKKLRAVPDVKDVFPRLSFFAFVVRGGITLGGKGEGVVAEKENTFFNRMNFVEGHEIQAEDQVILGKGLADSLGVKPGDQITVLTQTVSGQLNGADLTVAGVFHMGIKAIDDVFFRVSLKTAQSLLDTQKIELFSLATTGVEKWKDVSEELKRTAPELEAISFNDLDKVFYQNSVDFLEAQFNFVRAIILLIVGLGIFNTIAVGLLERAGEVGALRANGESRSRLFRIFLVENAMLGLCGGILGIIIAIILDNTLMAGGVPVPPAPGITRRYSVMLEIENFHMLSALLFPMIATILASIIPVRRLLKRSIPELLRST